MLTPSQVYSVSMDPLWITQPGERYAVRMIDADWALVVWELDPPDAVEWIQVDSNVELVRS